ncbi:hypothetical protein WMY93_010815 [Mugilogobius chulae]|uniref:K Homology domain-containing protein n=1 Tax=Mugilogobius chulae TaxID=88201 RepID=A0AAW0PE20_9GOBI
MEVGVSQSRVFVCPGPKAFVPKWSSLLCVRHIMDAIRDSPQGLTSGKVVALAAGLSVGATVGYMLYRHLSSNSQEVEIEMSKMVLPVDVYRNISKYQATFLDMVTQKSGAHVRVLSDSISSEVCFLLQGSKEQVLLARCVLESLVTDCEPVSETMGVPQTAFGRIIGRKGESLKHITRITGAKVACSKEKAQGPGATGSVTITGNRQEVQQAKALVLEKVKEDLLVRTKICQSSAQRHKRRLQPREKGECVETEVSMSLNNNSVVSKPEKQPSEINGTTGETEFEDLQSTCSDRSLSSESLAQISKFEIPSPDLSFQPDEHLEVYVSASENPNHFWIQILGVRSLQLDKLIEEMNRYYSNGNPSELRVESVVVGDIVAAPYKDHGTWNRARESLCRMRSDFLSLPFQAIECNLAGVKPKGDCWSEAALDDFERLTHCALWRPLQAKLCSYSHSEASSWPSVKLYDCTEGKTVDIGEELVRLGHASFNEMNGKLQGDNFDCLQKMLNEVVGASSELSLSCISLSEVPSISGSVEDVNELL